MEYRMQEMGMGPCGVLEVRVYVWNRQYTSVYMDRFGLVGDVKQRIAKEMNRKFHELKILVNQNEGVWEPDVQEKVRNLRGPGGTVDLTVVVNRTCRWCHYKLDTELGDFCSMRCHTRMAQEMQDPRTNVFPIFGMPERETAPSIEHYPVHPYGDH
eukprot:Skav236831  [mRNA]  locus=scaffold1707:292761:293228:- [translate_table: standard]